MTPTSPKDATKLEDVIEKWLVPIGSLLASLFRCIALFDIGAATVWSAGVAFQEWLAKARPPSRTCYCYSSI
jgi:hypothetical protein